MTLPPEIETAILEILHLHGMQSHATKIHHKRLDHIRKQLRTLSDDFAQRRSSEDSYPEAYCAYNFPMNFMKTMIVGKELRTSFPETFKSAQIRILDIGCGEGAGMLGLYYALKDSKDISLHGIDTSVVMLKKCRYIIEHALPEGIRLELRKHDAKNGLLKTKQEYDVVILANSLAEMFPDSIIPIRFIHRLFRNVSGAGIIIIIEPATKQLSRRLIDLRNRIIADTKLHVLLPCLHDSACPLHDLRKHREWCHQSITWQPPEFLSSINQELHREINVLKFSYLVLAQKNSPITTSDQYRVISNLLREKGKQRCFICTRTGRVELVRLNRDRSECNRTFGKIKKGDVISCQLLTKRRTDYWQVVRDSVVHIHHSRQ